VTDGIAIEWGERLPARKAELHLGHAPAWDLKTAAGAGCAKMLG